MKKIFVCLFFSFIFILFSCSQGLSSSNTSQYLSLLNNTSSTSSGQKFTVLTTSENSQIQFSNGRTILPEALSINDLDLYLYGQNKITGQEITFTSGSESTNCLKVSITKYSDDGTSGIFSINLASGMYSLTLAAVKSGKSFDKSDLATNTLLIGNATADPSVDTIVFCLSGKRFMNASGMYSTARLGLYTLGWTYSDYDSSSSSFACDVGIYKKDLNNTVLYEKTNFSLPHYDDSSSVPSNVDDFASNFIYRTTPGEYNFTVRFYDTNDSSRSYYYSDTIMLLGNQTTEKILEIPNIIGAKPEAPTSFICGYIDPSDQDAQKYSLNLEWLDNAKNEEYFQLELMDLSDTDDQAISNTYSEYVKCILGKSTEYSSSARDTAWSFLATNFQVTTIQNDYFEQMGMVSSNQVKGSLSRNSNTVIFPLLFGERYLVRLCAVNSEGSSSYVYPDIYSGGYRNTNANSWVWDDSVENNCNLGINRYKITYILNGGDFYNITTSEGSTSYENVTPYISMNKVIYSSQTKNGISLTNPLSISYTDPSDSSEKTASLGIYKNSSYYQWLSWKKSSVDGTPIADSSSIASYLYTGYKGMTLYANYDAQAENTGVLSVYNTENKKYGVPYSNICLMPSADAELHLSPVEVNSSNEISLSKSSYQNCFVTVKDVFFWVKVDFTKQGSQTENVGNVYKSDENRPTTTNHWTLTEYDANDNPSSSEVEVTHLYWPIDLSDYDAGTYWLSISAKEYLVSDISTYTIKIYITE